MSNECLRVKLITAGYEKEAVMAYEREELLVNYAEVLASGKLEKARP